MTMTMTKKEFIKHLVHQYEYDNSLTCDNDPGESVSVHSRFGVDDNLNLYCSDCCQYFLENPDEEKPGLIIIDRRYHSQYFSITKIGKLSDLAAVSSPAESREISEYAVKGA